jgi:MoaA/NifB/PqqE/SkfB family radical SAM enzyme
MNLRLVRLHLHINGAGQMLRRLLIEVGPYVHYGTARKLANLIRVYWQYVRREVVATGYPYRYYVEPTNACNLRCPFCFGWQERSKRPSGVMSLDTFRELVDQIAPYAYWLDLYNRGEPLLHPGILEMVDYAHKRGIATKISTNLHRLDDAGAEKLVKSGLDYLVVPLDGATQETYAFYRVGGELELVLANLRSIVACKSRLRSKTPRITIRTLAMRRNEHELEAIKAIARQTGVDNLIFTPMIINVNSERADQWLPTNPSHSFYDYALRSNKTMEETQACIELWSRGTINWDGRVFPCCFADGASEDLGCLADRSFADIWNSASNLASHLQAREAIF